MRRFSLPTLSVSVLALGLVAAPVTIDLQKELIGAKFAWAKGNGHGEGGGGGNGHAHGQDKAGKSADTDVSSTGSDEGTEVGGTEVEGQNQEHGLPSKAIDNKTNSGAYHSANAPDPNATEAADSKAPNPNSAVSYSRAPTEAPAEPTGNDPTTEQPAGEEPVGGTPPNTVEGEPTSGDPVGETPGVVEGEPSGDPTTSSL
jgi:hypothetical protein